MPFSIFLFNKHAKVIQIDIQSEKLGERRHNDVSMLADSKVALDAILEAGETRQPSAFYQACLANKENWNSWLDSFKDSDQMPVRPEPIFDVLNRTASNKAVFAVDVGNVDINFDRLINMHDDQKWATSGIYATMGFALPASIAAKLEYPDRDVYSLSGDGGFAMLMEEVMTQVKYGLHIVNIIFTNETLGFIEAEQTDDTHQPLSGVDLPDTNWAEVTKGMGAVSYTVHTKEDMQKALKDAENTDKPVVIDVKLTHEMPLTTQHMFLDTSWQDKDKVAEYVKKYQAQDLKPLSYFLKEAENHQLQTN